MRVIILCSALFLISPSCGMIENLGFGKVVLDIETGRIDAIASSLNVPLAGLSPQAIEAWYEDQLKTDVTVSQTAEGFQIEAASKTADILKALVKVPEGGFTLPSLIGGGIAAFGALVGIYKRRRRLKKLAAAPQAGVA